MGIVNVAIAYIFIKDLTIPFKKTKAYEEGIIDDEGVFLVKKENATPDQKKIWPNKLTVLAWNIKRLLSKVGIGRSSIASFATGLYLLKEEMRKQNMDSSNLEVTFVNFLEKNLYGNNEQKLINEAFESSIMMNTIDEGTYRVFDEIVDIKESKVSFDYMMGVPLFEAKTKSGRKIVFSSDDIEEEVPANNVGSGMIKGIAPGEDPPIRVKKKKRIYELMGKYTIFDVSPEEFEKCSGRKRKFEKWSKYFDEDSETGSAIKKYSYHNPEKGIILRNSETGQTMMFRRRWSDQRLSHNKRGKVLTQQSQNNKVYSIWTK